MGNCTIGTNVDGLVDLNPIRYRGYYYDKETQLYYLQTRYYDPAAGRFISSDTVKYLKPKSIHGLNLYAYCFNNPVMGVDPTGHDAIVVVENGLPILGHIVVYVQDGMGVWHKTEYTGDSEVWYNDDSSVSGYKEIDGGFIDVNDVYEDIENYPNGAKFTHIVGDFSKSADLINNKYKNESSFGKYNLLFNSCQTYALTILRAGKANNTAVNKYIQSPLAGITAIPSVFRMNLNAKVEAAAGNHIPRKEAEPVSKALYFTFGLLAFNPIFGLAVAGFYLHHHIVNGG